MNKKFAAVLAATCVLGATTAFAANPFSDVTPSDWAYQAVAQLAAEGVIDGYPDGTFKGERNITRYEMAQMVARAMARQDQVDAEQQAQIDRLANEFANELNSLGVRVTNLENRVGNVKVTGDARVRWQDDSKNDKFDMRGRLRFAAKVSDKTEAVARITTGNFRIDSEGNDADITLDQLYVAHKFDGFKLTGGRYGETLGETGYWYDDNVDGVKADFGYNDFKATVGYGTLKGITVGQYAYDVKVAELQAAAADAKTAAEKAVEENEKAEEATKIATNEAVEARLVMENVERDLYAAGERLKDLPQAQEAEKAAKEVYDAAKKKLDDAEKALKEGDRSNLEEYANVYKAWQAAQNEASEARYAWREKVKQAEKIGNDYDNALKLYDEKYSVAAEKARASVKAAEAYEASKVARTAAVEAQTAADDALKAYTSKDNQKKVITSGMEAAYGQLAYQGKNFHLVGVYVAPNGDKVKADKLDSVWGAGAAVMLGEQFKLSGDYFSVQGEGSRKDAAFWVARADFGKADMKKPGSFNIYVDYVDAEPYSYLGGSGAMRAGYLLNDTKSWGVGAGFVVAENVKLEAFRSFNAETHAGVDLDDYTKVQLVYKF